MDIKYTVSKLKNSKIQEIKDSVAVMKGLVIHEQTKKIIAESDAKFLII